MSSAPVQLTFAVQFATFVVAAGGFALVLLRVQYLGRRLRDEVALAFGFAAVAVVSFLHGALVGPSEFTAGIVVQAAGLALLLLGGVFGGKLRPSVVLGSAATRVPGEASAAAATVALGVGVVAQAAALGTQAAAPLVSAGLLAAGAVSIGAALVLSSRRSIAGRVAASAGFTLLALVLVLSVALSAVLSSTVQKEAIKSLETQAGAEVTQVKTLTEVDLPEEARLIEAVFHEYLVLHPACSASCIRQEIQLVSVYLPTVPSSAALWISPGSTKAGVSQVLASSVNASSLLGASTGASVAMSATVSKAITQDRTTASVEVVAGRSLSVAAYPYAVTHSKASGAPRQVLGVAVVVAPLDDAFLGAQVKTDPTVSLGLIGGGGFLGTSGALPRYKFLRPLAAATLSFGASAQGSFGDQYVAVQPVLDSAGVPVAALVAATSTRPVLLSQDSLFRTLFLIALGGTLLALLLASAIGERIGAGLRRLTLAADAIRGGGRGVRAGVETGDEVGELGAAFDSMATSIDDKTAALLQAAEDEATLRGRLEAVVAGMGEALLAVDELGRITDFNQAAEELIGLSRASVLGEPVDEVVVLVDEDGRDISAQLRKPPELRWSVDATVVRRGANGPARVPVAVSAGDVRGTGMLGVGVVFVMRDLRSEREVERMKSEFLSRVGHELRTPLTGIMGFSELLARAEVSPSRAAGWHREILEQSKRLLRTVEMLEFFASAGAGRVFLRKEMLDPGALVDEVAETWSARVNGSRRVLRRVARDLPPLLADRRWLALALDELVDNAVKFSPEGAQVIVRVDATTDRRSVELSVIDQGKGMSQVEAAQAFTDFVQGDSSDTRSYGGLGLGLSLVQQVAEGHGGRVICESTPGSGSRFSIVIPVSADAGPTANPTPPASPTANVV